MCGIKHCSRALLQRFQARLKPPRVAIKRRNNRLELADLRLDERMRRSEHPHTNCHQSFATARTCPSMASMTPRNGVNDASFALSALANTPRPAARSAMLP